MFTHIVLFKRPHGHSEERCDFVRLFMLRTRAPLDRITITNLPQVKWTANNKQTKKSSVSRKFWWRQKKVFEQKSKFGRWRKLVKRARREKRCSIISSRRTQLIRFEQHFTATYLCQTMPTYAIATYVIFTINHQLRLTQLIMLRQHFTTFAIYYKYHRWLCRINYNLITS